MFRQMSAGAGLGALAALEVKCLHPGQEFLFVAEPGAGQLIEVARVGRLLFGQHAAFTGTDARAGQFGPFRQGNLGLLG